MLYCDTITMVFGHHITQTIFQESSVMWCFYFSPHYCARLATLGIILGYSRLFNWARHSQSYRAITLYNRLFEQKPSLNKGELALLYRKQDGTCDNAHLYGFILIMRRLLLPDDFAAMKASIIALTEKYPFVRMSYYGFRSDWKTALWWFWFKKHIIVLTSPTSRKAQYCGRSVGGDRENLFPLFI